jgi:hypothetical protein
MRRWKVEIADSVLELRRQLAALHAEPVLSKGAARRGGASEGAAGAPGVLVAPALLKNRPAGAWDLFQDQTPLSFSGATGRAETWWPPALATAGEGAPELAPYGSWTGQLDRCELVRDLSRVVNVNGNALSAVEVEYAVKVLEALEQSAQKENLDSAFRCAVDLLRRFPNWAAPYFKAGLLLLAIERAAALRQANAEVARMRTVSAETLQDGESTVVPEPVADHDGGSLGDAARQAAREAALYTETASATGDEMAAEVAASRAPLVEQATLMQAANFFRCAAEIEPENRHLLGLTDLTLRLASGVYVPRTSVLRDPALYPRTLGDAVALALLDSAGNVST